MSSSSELHVESPRGKTTIRCESRTPTLLTDLLARYGLSLNTRCGQRGLCDACTVELTAGSLLNTATGHKLDAHGHTPITVRGCQHAVIPGCSADIHIDARALLSHRPHVVNQFKLNVPYAHDPLWQPAEGIYAAGGKADLGVAVDIGTTTVALLLVDLANGEIVGKASDFNAQMDLGDNVLTRINLCLNDRAMIARLQKSVARGTLRKLLTESLQQANATTDQRRVTRIAANTTMLHLLAGVDPSTMGYAPFTAVFLEHRIEDAFDLGICDGPKSHHIPVHLLPSAAAYVGADLTAGVLSSGLAYDEGPNLLVDVGTNGEIILKHGEKTLGCATAAGPAFEGAGLKSGVRAGDGAVSHVRIHNEQLEYDLIGAGDDVHPIGLCGTAYIDVMAHGKKSGLLSETGRFQTDHGRFDQWLDQQDEHGPRLRVAYGQGKRPILVTETDLASLLQAKAAIAAGILTLLHRVGMSPADVQKLYLAGGFGMHMDVSSAIGSGLLPGFRREQVELVGNTSLAGAYMALLDRGAMDEIRRIASSMEIVELNLDPAFENCYIDQLSLPD
ncbi:MAG: DUF4445 domain-containing protein [Phycisphaeraceae bacterium]|nr:DUF4445 domain-containing protein [Phycisphaeraceae bacterium]